jgi:cell division septum initiation protein DivIVA
MELKFSRTRHGYEPREVDAVIIELQKQIQAHKNTIIQYNDKFQQVSDNMKRLEDERAKESLRVTGMMHAAAQMAEQTELAARQKAQEIISASQRETAQIAGAVRLEAAKITETAKQESSRIINDANQDAANIRNQAQVDYETVREILTLLGESVQTIRKNNSLYIDTTQRFAKGTDTRLNEIDDVVNKALNVIPAAPEPSAFTIITTPAEPEYTDPPAAPVYMPPSATEDTQATGSETDPYTSYVERMKAEGKIPKYPQDDN